MEECEVIDLYELHYSELSSPSSSKVEDSIMEALGSNGPGLLAVPGIPNISNLRSYLLPLARKLSLLDSQTRNRILKVVLSIYFYWYYVAPTPLIECVRHLHHTNTYDYI